MKNFKKHLILLCLYIGYLMHTYSRRSFPSVINYVRKEEFLNTELIGLIVSFQQIGYTMSKFVQPFIIDKINPKIFFSLTMFATFICIFPFSYSTSFYHLLTFYCIHGFCLAYAWPSLAKILKQIISQNEFGFWWSVQCTSSNVGAIFGAIVSTYLSDRYGWRLSVRFCALVNLGCAVIIALVFILITLPPPRIDSKLVGKPNKHSLSYLDFLSNPVLLANNIMFFCVYICRYVISDWYQVHLSDLQFPQYIIAGFLSAMETGGTVGSLMAGIMADNLLVHLTGTKNPRLYVIIICGGLIAATMHMLIFAVNSQTTQYTLSLMGFTFGLFIFGPVAVSGIIAIEGAPPEQQGMSFALNVIFANVAMLFTGYPVSFLGQRFGWKTIFLISYFAMCASTTILILSRNCSTPVDALDLSEPRTPSIVKTKSSQFDLQE